MYHCTRNIWTLLQALIVLFISLCCAGVEAEVTVIESKLYRYSPQSRSQINGIRDNVRLNNFFERNSQNNENQSIAEYSLILKNFDENYYGPEIDRDSNTPKNAKARYQRRKNEKPQHEDDNDIYVGNSESYSQLNNVLENFPFYRSKLIPFWLNRNWEYVSTIKSKDFNRPSNTTIIEDTTEPLPIAHLSSKTTQVFTTSDANDKDTKGINRAVAVAAARSLSSGEQLRDLLEQARATTYSYVLALNLNTITLTIAAILLILSFFGVPPGLVLATIANLSFF